MTFEEIKAIILKNAYRVEVCPDYQVAQLATSFQELIALMPTYIFWAYQRSVLTDDLLSEFEESELNEVGIYTTGTPTINNPPADIYLLKNVNAVINLSGTQQQMVFGMGKAVVNINSSENAYCETKLYNECNVTHTIWGNATTIHTSQDDSISSITASNNGIAHIYSNGNSLINYIGNDFSYANIKALVKSTIKVISLSPNAKIDTNKSQNSVIILPVTDGVCNYSVNNLSVYPSQQFVALSWDISPDEGKLNLLRYKLSSESEWGNPIEVSNPGPNPPGQHAGYTLTNLAPSTSYDVMITVQCSPGNESIGASISFTTRNAGPILIS